MKCTNLSRSVKLSIATLVTATLGLSSADALETFRWVTTSGADIHASFTITDDAYARGWIAEQLYRPITVYDMYRIEVDISNLWTEYVHGPVWWQRNGVLMTSSHADLYSLFGSISPDGQSIAMSYFQATYGTGSPSAEFFNMSGNGNGLGVGYTLIYGPGMNGFSDTRSSTGYWARVPTPQRLTIAPKELGSCLGESAVFNVDAEFGKRPFSYQWYFNGTNLLAGETNSQLRLLNLTADQAGAYSAVITNEFGSAKSPSAMLTVFDACVGMNLYAGLSITGLVGRTYSLEYVTNVTETNWTVLATNVMTQPKWLFIDTNTPAEPKKFFRVRLQP